MSISPASSTSVAQWAAGLEEVELAGLIDIQTTSYTLSVAL
jgi:hypothetical protein